MKKLQILFDSANEYVSQCSWKDISLVKICVLAFGIAIGSSIPKKYKSRVRPVMLFLYTITLFFILMKFTPILLKHLSGDKSEE